jgi:hypothetical protein
MSSGSRRVSSGSIAKMGMRGSFDSTLWIGDVLSFSMILIGDQASFRRERIAGPVPR